MSTSASLPIDDSARRLGALAWLEQRCFAITGAAALKAPTGDVGAHFDVMSFQHAWHAELFIDRLPVRDGVGVGDFIAPPTAATARAFDLWERAADNIGAEFGATVVLGVCHRVVVPRLVTTYSAHLRLSQRVADAPVIRALRLVRRDLIEIGLAGEILLESQLCEKAALDALGLAVGSFEAMLIEEGSIRGFVRE